MKKIVSLISIVMISGCASDRHECNHCCHERHRPNVTVHSDGGPCKVIFIKKDCKNRVIRKVSEYEEF